MFAYLGAAVATVAMPIAAPDSAAASWASLLDQQQWEQSWAAAGDAFRSRLSQEAWTTAVRPVRAPLGALVSRKLKDVSATRSLPGAPDGDYRIVTFDTVFANKANAVETVVLVGERGTWKVSGYFIR